MKIHFRNILITVASFLLLDDLINKVRNKKLFKGNYKSYLLPAGLILTILGLLYSGNNKDS